ncbi:MAG: hypothetical protein UY31_C0045G0005 [Candidatus Wolfebacteria bacterium GW2011_GWE1_48_7]|uniref:Outer membrane protein beta-barrel domain-containing protein n=2 Tax=Candidatus Wolfeibacteriota TaxID=1752735 RepID=A0A0G4ASV4_9BACT|nr:MAG: hypothetical protein UX70_C0001G0998 [Candidatus Wolfebacteria bacterium GW2011_GWB1_47_1]KKU35255.1 MAG: hypothetical protein UX49_C0028G0007 [Candidatus Wolfebacteria bacterium GW2011_GWC2_46_275]KKU41165.1 MAG: hypothetical protein UX58_C0010G0009 [Candidatus Wolfebacteria bacterium GW2011_GWB2_46_69]KKU53410.1 MAG: hypothetical protein UX76_C0017G0007 [Candidatus Wolfebacteria bacterium GW2011_GWC1_47_103]KKU70917.1 MAG: hypothetical protein UX96_C0032G0007 [Candidatus Wolfebacteria
MELGQLLCASAHIQKGGENVKKMELQMFGLGVLGALVIAATMFLGTTNVLAADNLPLDNQTGAYAGIEASTNYMRVKTVPDVDTTYTIATPTVLATAGYGTEQYSLGILGGLGSPSVRNAFDAFGDAKDTVSVFGLSAKVVPMKISYAKIGLVADVRRLGSASDSSKGSMYGNPVDAQLDYGPMWLWSVGAIAQYQPSKQFAVYAGEKYEDITHAKAVMSANMYTSQNVYSNAMCVKFEQVNNFATVAGIVLMPTERVNIILQGRYLERVPISATANIEYRF